MTDRSSKNIAIGIVVLAVLLIGSLALWRVLFAAEAHVELDRSRYPIVGIDLSAHNGIPDFDSIAAAGVHFVYLKASEGETFRDKAFIRNYAAARRAGLMVGAYHFFRFDCDGSRQASNFLEAVGQCRLDLPPAIDVEESGNPSGESTDVIVSRLKAMMATVEPRYGKVMVYTNKNGDARFLRSYFSDAGSEAPLLWICSFTDPPINRRQWHLWQHSHRAIVPGVKTRVDMNTFNGDSAQWAQWLRECLIIKLKMNRSQNMQNG